jgi:hypothetical protein
MWSMRERKKSSVAGQAKFTEHSQKSRTRGCEIGRYFSRESAKTQAKSNSYG